jgi:hypothetical protein
MGSRGYALATSHEAVASNTCDVAGECMVSERVGSGLPSREEKLEGKKQKKRAHGQEGGRPWARRDPKATFVIIITIEAGGCQPQILELSAGSPREGSPLLPSGKNVQRSRAASRSSRCSRNFFK